MNPSPTGNRLYSAYRKIRFLAKRGTLFFPKKATERDGTVISRKTFRIIYLNSLLLYLLAYLTIYLVHLLATGLVAVAFNIPVKIFYNEVDFLIRGIDWTPDSVSGVFSGGPLAMLVLTVFLLLLYFAVSTEKGLMRLLVYWMILHSLTLLLGDVLIGAILGVGFGYVMSYMYITDSWKVILTIGMCVSLFTSGLMLARWGLFTANTYFNDLRSNYRQRFIVNQFILPFFTGLILITGIKSPDFDPFDLFLNSTMIFILVPIMIRAGTLQDLYFDEESRSNAVSVKALLITVSAVILFRLVLGIGIRL